MPVLPVCNHNDMECIEENERKEEIAENKENQLDEEPDNLQYEAVKDVVINEAIKKVNIIGSVLQSVNSRMADFFKKTLKNKKVAKADIVVEYDVEQTIFVEMPVQNNQIEKKNEESEIEGKQENEL